MCSSGGEMHRVILAGLASLAASVVFAQKGSEITVISFGRANQAAMETAYFKPFAQSTRIAVNALTYDGQTDELEKMVKSGKPAWDVIQVEKRTLDLGCREGLFEKLDRRAIGNPIDAV